MIQSAQDVEQLRKFVDAQLSDQPTDAGDAWVAERRPARDAVLLRIVAHAAKLEHGKWLARPAHAAGTGNIFVSTERGNEVVVLDSGFNIIKRIATSRRPRTMQCPPPLPPNQSWRTS